MRDFIDIGVLHDITCVLPEGSNAKVYQIDGSFYATINMLKDLVVAFRGDHIVEIYDTGDVEKVVAGEVEAVSRFDSHLYLDPQRGFAVEVKKIVA